MIPMRTGEIAEVVGGELTQPDHADELVTGPASVDSRQITPGGIFAAIAGERVDGHDFTDTALDAGAALVLASRPGAGPTVVVADVTEALGRLARHLVDRLPAMSVVALTGSQGKTGTKDYAAQILATDGPTVATEGNLNNELGVPLTVLRANAETRHLVVEMGARGIGHVHYLCSVAPPRIAAVLNVGTAHVGEFGSREAIALAKGEIVEAVPPDGVSVLNADDPMVAAMAERAGGRVITFGAAADVSYTDVELDELGRPVFRLRSGDEDRAVALALPGRHQVANATAAAAVSLSSGMELTRVAEALAAARPVSRWRMELKELAEGSLLLNDSYNANPDSMVAALETLAAIGARRRTQGSRTIAVLGEMRELGE